MACRLRSSSIQRTALVALFVALSSAAHGQAPAPATPPQPAATPTATPSATTPAAPGPQAASEPGAKAEERPKDEVATHDSPATFQVRVNLVQVRVVVRGPDGKIIPNLHREDFQIFDNRKPQLISTFNVDTAEAKAVVSAAAGAPTPEETAEAAHAAVVAKLPQRFVAIMFDDVHLSIEDAVFVRSTATDFLKSLAPEDRVGIYSSSGQIKQEFTADREVLKKTLLGILPHSVTAGGGYHPCPEVTYYQADQIVNQNNTQALLVAAEDTVQCQYNGDETKLGVAQQFAAVAASQALSVGDDENTYTYSHLSDVTRHLATMPGQRVLVFISPGFILSTLFDQMTDLIDRANHGKITINTIDARGLYTPDFGDIADPPRLNGKTAGLELMYRTQAQFAQEEVLADMASGTGGTYFHNRNDLGEGLREAAAAPEVSYLLGFSPQNLKIDGKFHELKVTLADKRKVSVQARRGYYAPRTIKDPEAAAKADIQEAIFSQDEIRDIPVDLQTQFFKTDANAAKIAVLSHFDLRGVHFRKVNGRSDDNLTIATAIFDENGNFVTGGEKIVEMKLLEPTLERLNRSGLTVKSSFDVKPGTYLVRLVVRDAEGAEMAARNGAVSIPY